MKTITKEKIPDKPIYNMPSIQIVELTRADMLVTSGEKNYENSGEWDNVTTY